jgi:hypothetical protein
LSWIALNELNLQWNIKKSSTVQYKKAIEDTEPEGEARERQ